MNGRYGIQLGGNCGIGSSDMEGADAINYGSIIWSYLQLPIVTPNTEGVVLNEHRIGGVNE